MKRANSQEVPKSSGTREPSWLLRFQNSIQNVRSKEPTKGTNWGKHFCLIFAVVFVFSINVRSSTSSDAYASAIGHITTISNEDRKSDTLSTQQNSDSSERSGKSKTSKDFFFEEDPYSIEPSKKEKKIIPVSVIDEYDLRKNLSNEHLELVQTVPELEYNVVPRDGRKYFMFTPSGGFNNQRICLEYAVRIGKILNRSVIAPMAGKHLNFWHRYYNQSLDTLVPMDTLLDFEYLQTYGTDLIPTNIPLKQLEKQLKEEGRLQVIYKKYRAMWKESEIPTQLGSDAEILMLKGPTMYHKWFSPETIEHTRTYVVYSKLVRRTAFEIMKVLGSKYNAVHIRLGDYAETPKSGSRTFTAPDPERIVKDLVGKKGFDISVPLYIATEPEWARKRSIWLPFRRKYKYKNLFYAHNFKSITTQYAELFPEAVVGDFLGLVEQMICVGAKKFSGSWFSNFSANILLMRRQKWKSFPESVLFGDLLDEMRELTLWKKQNK
mmetsp:Transcript_6235/g.7582  ORF Transcript_6235/g.7582 Transcript_6235/m.7582 type:complete len:493 (+) Transcript_6235:231-1709(+)